MIIETIASAKSVEAAIELGAAELKMPVERVMTDVLEEPKSGFLGFGATDAKVRVYYVITPAMRADKFIKKFLENLGVEAEITLAEENDDGARFDINGDSDDLGLLIGRHGETLDSFQYLASLAANKLDKEDEGLVSLPEGGFYRVSIDINGYRVKREETLKALAHKMAEKAKKYRKNITLEPMSANERRIIHSEVQNIPGVTTFSVGQDKDRKVVISPENRRPAPRI